MVNCIPQDRYNKDEIAAKLLDYFDGNDFHFKEKTVFLKPSFVFAISDKEKALGTNTHNAVVAGTAIALSRLGAKKILIAEHRTIGPARYGFLMVGIKKDIKGINNVQLCYLDEETCVPVRVENPFIPDHVIQYPKLLLDGGVDFFISLPKLKSNLFAGITLSVKNNYGLVNRKERLRYHNDMLHKNLADISLIRLPDLTITDAIISGEGQGPMEVEPVKTNVLIIGKNCLAVDAVCCHLMMQDPGEIEHLKLLYQRGVGPLSIEEIDVEGMEYLETKKKHFQEPDHTLEMTPNIRLYIGNKACKGGCLGMIRHILDAYGRNKGWNSLGDLNIMIGEGVDIPEEELKTLHKNRTIIYGNCARKYRRYGTFLKGCPPDYLSAIFKLWISGPLSTNPWFKYISFSKFFIAYLRHGIKRLFKI